MSQGTVTIFNEAKQNIGNTLLDLSSAADFKVMLITTLPTAEDLTPDSADYTEVSPIGSEYVAGGLALTVTWNEAAGTVTFDDTINPAWTKDVTGPTNIVAALIYSITAVGEDALGFVDMTTDGGTTPISLAVGNISITWDANGIFSIA